MRVEQRWEKLKDYLREEHRLATTAGREYFCDEILGLMNRLERNVSVEQVSALLSLAQQNLIWDACGAWNAKHDSRMAVSVYELMAIKMALENNDTSELEKWIEPMKGGDKIVYG